LSEVKNLPGLPNMAGLASPEMILMKIYKTAEGVN
jgi:hypothetical protein